MSDGKRPGSDHGTRGSAGQPPCRGSGTTDALRESEEKYKLLIEATSTGYVIIDEQGRVLDANDEYVRLTGRGSLGEIAGRAVTEGTAPYDLERNASEVAKCAASGSVRNLVIDYVGPQGTVTPVELNATLLHTPGPPRIFTICSDISARRHSEDLLQRSETQHRMLYERTPAMMHSIDARGGCW